MRKKRSRARKETMHFRFLSCRFAERHDTPKRHKLDIIVGTLCRHRNKVLRQPCLVSFTAIKFTISKGYILLFVITLLFPGTTRLRRCVCVPSTPFESSIDKHNIFSHVDFVKRMKPYRSHLTQKLCFWLFFCRRSFFQMKGMKILCG